jgi:cell wall integrity and stress response component
MAARRGLCALALNALFIFSTAMPSVPLATDPILVTATVSTVIPSLVTLYSVVPATDATPGPASTITTTIAGQVTTLTSLEVVAGSITSTIISTLSLTTTQVVVSTVGYSTIFGPDPTPTPAESTSTTQSISSQSVPSTTPFQSTSTTSSSTSTSSSESAHSATTSASESSSTSIAAGTSPSSHSSGLSTGAKAGIGIAVALIVLVLVALSFFLGQRYSRRRNQRSANETDSEVIEEKEVFQAGLPYESTGKGGNSPTATMGKAHAYSINTTVIGSESPSVSGRSYEPPRSPPPNTHQDSSELSALPSIDDATDQMYIGVPAHMSGSKRWSMKEFAK